MNRLKSVLLLAAMVFAAPSEAQVVDSVVVDIVGPPAAIQIDAPRLTYVGDTVTVNYTIVDDQGEKTFGVTTWEVDPPGRASILSETDSTVVMVVNQRGRLTLRVTVERMDSLVIGHQLLDDEGELTGMFRLGGDIHLVVGQRARLCAVGYAGPRPIMASDELCRAHVASAFLSPGLRQALKLEPDLLRRALAPAD